MMKVGLAEIGGIFRIVDDRGQPARFPGKAKHLLDLGGFSTAEAAGAALAKLPANLFEVSPAALAAAQPEPAEPATQAEQQDAPVSQAEIEALNQEAEHGADGAAHLEGATVTVIADGAGAAPADGEAEKPAAAAE